MNPDKFEIKDTIFCKPLNTYAKIKKYIESENKYACFSIKNKNAKVTPNLDKS